jgi:hypothetical protein
MLADGRMLLRRMPGTPRTYGAKVDQLLDGELFSHRACCPKGFLETISLFQTNSEMLREYGI